MNGLDGKIFPINNGANGSFTLNICRLDSENQIELDLQQNSFVNNKWEIVSFKAGHVYGLNPKLEVSEFAELAGAVCEVVTNDL